MGEKRPQPTAVLVKRLRRAGKWFDSLALRSTIPIRQLRAHTNTLWQCQARLEALAAELERLDRVGGLGLDVHARIRAALDGTV